ncbi:hypothetical protein F4815DRAFT_503481 [Daldinia loculata]|nr:hypothetical protein F4815DRAFT_503481 [Daldinia loculata]
MARNPTQTPDVQSPKERDDGAIDQLCGQLQQLRYSHSLPTELLLNIVECFRLPVQDVASTLPAPEFLVNRKVLYNLCLTSSVFNDLATPLLYQTVIFFIDSRDYDDYLRALAYGGPRSLIMLVRTLLSKEDYCKHIENIICPGSLKPHDWGIPDNIEREVTRLLLRWYDSSRYQTLDYLLRQATMQSRYSIIPQLLTLYIQQLAFSRSFSGSSMEIATELLEIGGVHRLHVWYQYGYLTFPAGRDNSWIGRIRELKLVTWVDAETIFRIFESAAKLESFSLIVAKSRDLHRPLPSTGRDLNHALVKVASTLKVLELRTCQNTWFLGQLGPSQVLDCLPQLEKLETLTTEIPLITGIQTNTHDTRILQKLPPNLISLDAVEMWGNLESGFTRKEDFIMAFSTTFVSELLRGLLPSLKHVRYIPAVVKCCLGPRQLDAMKILFDTAHVSFSHEADSLPRGFFYYLHD